MTAAIQFFKKYPICTICYFVYIWICYEMVQARMFFHNLVKTGKSGISSGEGFVYLEIFFIMISGIFFLIILINAIAKKEIVVYGWLCLIIVVQALVALNVG